MSLAFLLTQFSTLQFLFFQEDFQHPPGSVRDLIAQFFLNESLVTR
jgi:hypothetical protein